MGYACYERNGRDQGYGVPAKCDHPGCDADIDRGMAYACGGEPTENCGLFFCGKHLQHHRMPGTNKWTRAICDRCANDEEPFDPSPDTQEWIDHKLTHQSWADWRYENPEWVRQQRKNRERKKRQNFWFHVFWFNMTVILGAAVLLMLQ